MKPLKLFVCTRKDLGIAQRAVQSCHAVAEFCLRHPDIASEWSKSNYMVLLEVDDEDSLFDLCDKAFDKGFKYSNFIEPDIDHQMTAVVLEPAAEKLVRKLPLAFSGT